MLVLGRGHCAAAARGAETWGEHVTQCRQFQTGRWR